MNQRLKEKINTNYKRMPVSSSRLAKTKDRSVLKGGEPKTKISALDKRILDRLQRDIPFTQRPWKIIARQLNIGESLLLKRIEFLKKKGIIRRISATFSPGKIGFVSTLVAAKVASQNIDKVAERLNAHSEVTHNYKRDSEYNLWFTLITQNRSRISQIIDRIKKDKEINEILELPVVRLFKIEVNFKA